MPEFTRTAYCSDYETTVSLDIEFEESFDVEPQEYVEACSPRECGELLDAIVAEHSLHNVLPHADDDTLHELAEALGVTLQDSAPSVPIPDLNLSSSDIARIPGQMLADNLTWVQLKDIFLALPCGRERALKSAWEVLTPSAKERLFAALGTQPPVPSTPREPVDDALELLSDVDRNHLLGLPDATLNHLRALLAEA